MEGTFLNPNASPYVTAPSSPVSGTGGCQNKSMWFYSAPASPIRRAESFLDCESGRSKIEEDDSSRFDDFEFETSRKFGSEMDFEASEVKFEWQGNNDEEEHPVQQRKQNQRKRGDSLPMMAFADELFSNGLVLPLKLPPRLQTGNDVQSASQSSASASPKSPTSILKLPFARWVSRNDDFDPFLVALEKVREEKRGRLHGTHRQICSLSPFRTATAAASTKKEENPSPNPNSNRNQALHQIAPNSQKLTESKGSAYARWARKASNMGSPEGSNKSKGLPFGKGARLRKTCQERVIKPSPTAKIKEVEAGEEGGGVVLETRTEKFKGVLLRIASFGRDGNNERKQTSQIATLWKPTYFKRLSFKLKGAGKKRVSTESKMAVVPYRPTMSLCLGFGFGSPRNIDRAHHAI